MPDSYWARVGHQRALADFHDYASQSEDLNEILTEACWRASRALGTERAKVLEIEPEGESLLVRAGLGWHPGVVGHARVFLHEGVSDAFAVRTREPVVVQDIRTDRRFDLPGFMHAEGVRALANVPILRTDPQAFGLLEVDDTRPRDFDKTDVAILTRYAAVLGWAIDRLQAV
ncbi:GAF domain-containing protein [Rubellimicrobium roseum]|uniref:GAF domain-containing protein n=1 Tax=Rubellimicrobium roseum TaxID=687525 RepID=A0A5C4N4R2_9RHOB|nr:GAF domain-containing protein [Rubellimicrobium roseum]TNC60059.1 GAF domain-containing protein [Rubellimicrobium roseum]